MAVFRVRNRLRYVVAAGLMVLILLSGCFDGGLPIESTSITPTSISIDAAELYTDRYGRTIAIEDVASIMVTSVVQVLVDADWGVPNTKKCVAINPLWQPQFKDEPLPGSLVTAISSKLEEDLDMPVYESDFEGAAASCQRPFTQTIEFGSISMGRISEGKISIELRERHPGTYGGSDWVYDFARENNRWILVGSVSPSTS